MDKSAAYLKDPSELHLRQEAELTVSIFARQELLSIFNGLVGKPGADAKTLVAHHLLVSYVKAARLVQRPGQKTFDQKSADKACLARLAYTVECFENSGAEPLPSLYKTIAAKLDGFATSSGVANNRLRATAAWQRVLTLAGHAPKPKHAETRKTRKTRSKKVKPAAANQTLSQG